MQGQKPKQIPRRMERQAAALWLRFVRFLSASSLLVGIVVAVLAVLWGLAVPPAFAQATPQSIARRIMDVCVEARYAQGIDRARIAPQCRCAAELATSRLGFGGISERPVPGQKLTTRQSSNLDLALADCQDAGLEKGE